MQSDDGKALADLDAILGEDPDDMWHSAVKTGFDAPVGTRPAEAGAHHVAPAQAGDGAKSTPDVALLQPEWCA
jgi:hypothetical protein